MQFQAAQLQRFRPFILATSAGRVRQALKPQILVHSVLRCPLRLQLPWRHVPPLAAPAVAAAGAAAAPASQSLALFYDGWPLWCLLTACGAIAQVCAARTRWGAALSAPLVAMQCAAALAAGGLIPTDCAAYGAVWRYLMPLAAACFLLETDVQRLASHGGPVLTSFAVGTLGMVLGALAGWWLLREPLGSVGAKLAACLCASYVGGSVNFAALALALNVPAASLPGAMAADNLLMAAFLGALMAVPARQAAAAAAAAADNHHHKHEHRAHDPELLPEGVGSAAVENRCAVAGELAAPMAAAAAEWAEPAVWGPYPEPRVTAESLSLTLAAAAVSCTVAHHMAMALNVVPLTLLILAVVAAALAAAAHWLRTAMAATGGDDVGKMAAAPAGLAFSGAAQLGSSLMMLFFAVIGASAGSSACLADCGVLIPFLSVMVSVHWVVLVVLGRWLLQLPAEALLLGSNACIGGPATAAGAAEEARGTRKGDFTAKMPQTPMAAARGWRPLIQPAMLAGSLGYATGTAAGLAVARVIGAA